VSTLIAPKDRLGVELISGRRWLLPVLFAYGIMVDPSTGEGGIPCLWRLLFGITCPGCGLSRANAFLVRGHFTEGIAMNWLIIPVWLVATSVFVQAFLQHSPTKRTVNR
jgi:hypothetical protein